MPDQPLFVMGFAAAVHALLMAGLWVFHWRRRDATVVDVGWTIGLGLFALCYAFMLEGELGRRLLVAGIVSVWAGRLTYYLLVHRVIGKPEDGRYQTLRRRWGDSAPLYFFFLFEAQVVLATLFSLPILAALLRPGSFPDVWDWLGLAVGLLAIVGESSADRQLARFRADPENKGQVCQVGWWRYSRHPNYFFEWLHWWAYVLIGVGGVWWPLTLLGPALMLLFLIFITGIRATEAHAVESRGEAYRRYQRTTSAFIPWFPSTEAK